MIEEEVLQLLASRLHLKDPLADTLMGLVGTIDQATGKLEQVRSKN